MKIGAINCFSRYNTNFSGKKINEKKFERRMKYLEEHEVSPVYAEQIALLNNKRYRKSVPLVEMGLSPLSITSVARLENRQYRKARELINKGFLDDNIIPVAKLKKDCYASALDYWSKGIDSDAVFYMAKLSPEEFEEAQRLMAQGLPPKTAAFYAMMSEEERKNAEEFEPYKLEVETLKEIAQADEASRSECKQYIEMGINADFAIDLTTLDEAAKAKLPTLIELEIGDENLFDFATLDEENYEQAIELLNEGVLSSYIQAIIDIENEDEENKEYNKFREQGYSYTSSYALSLLDQEEIEALEEIEEKNPNIKELFKEEYDINIIKNQLTSEPEALLSREFKKDDGTKVTIVHVFDEEGKEFISTLEKYKDNSSMSVLEGGTRIFKTKYDKFGEIRETQQLTLNLDTGNVDGVIISKASDVLRGTFNSIYHSINPELSPDKASHTDITPYLSKESEVISKAEINPDGSVSYHEIFEINDTKTERDYTEIRNKDGEIEYETYSYKITTESGDTLLDLKRSMETHKDGSKTNIINGVRYRLTYDDENKTVQITDGKRTKVIEMAEKLPYYSSDIIWNNIKQQPVDILLTIEKAKKWKYCDDTDSCADEHNQCLSTGKTQSIIAHEAGHLKDYEKTGNACETDTEAVNGKTYISSDKDFMPVYDEEMQIFFSNFPYNEQEFILYFSPLADLNDSDGTSEFLAEANILLTTYGANHYKLTTRPQLLARYFPKSIAKVAELTGRTSKTSLLEL